MSLHLVPDLPPLALPSALELLEALPMAAYAVDADGRLTAFNKAAEDLWGRKPHLGEEYWCGSHKLYHADGRTMPHDQCPVALTLKTGKPVRGVEVILERPDGKRVYLLPHPTLFRGDNGVVVGALNVLVDISDRITADRSHANLAAIIESSDDAIVSKGLDGVIRSWNKAAERIFGYSAEEVVGQHISVLIPADRQDEEPGIIERIRRGERVDHFETVRRRKDGTLLDISLTISPVKNARGEIIGASKIARDITERKRTEEAKDLLLHEIKHRVKNTLGTVQAISGQTFRAGPREEREAFSGRLRALSNAHDLLTHQDWDEISVGDIVARALAPFRESRHARFEIAGETAILDANRALLLSMALHELATNAVKYGALSNDSGVVGVDWSVMAEDGPARLVMVWRERGGPEVVPATRKGFGSTLIERALSQEKGRSCFEFLPEGLRCTLEMQV